MYFLIFWACFYSDACFPPIWQPGLNFHALRPIRAAYYLSATTATDNFKTNESKFCFLNYPCFLFVLITVYDIHKLHHGVQNVVADSEEKGNVARYVAISSCHG